MHYGYRDFTSNGADTLETVPVGIPFGQRIRLSAGDIDGISRVYGFTPTNTTITTVPEGLPIVVDGVPGVSPQAFPWTPGSQHSISVSAQFGTDPLYRLAGWTDGGFATHTVTASTAVTVLAAVFQRLHSVSIVAAGNGSVSLYPPSPDGYYPERMLLKITATPGAGSKLYMWSGLPDLQSNGYGLASENAVLEVPTVSTSYTAFFTPQVMTTIDSQPQGRQVIVDGGLYLTPARFGWLPGSAHNVSLAAQQTASDLASRYRFTAWENGGSQTSRTVVAGLSDSTFKATFSTQYLLSTVANGPGAVTASPVSTDGFYDAGSMVQVIAMPTDGNTLQYWMGDLLGDSPVATVKMDQPRNVLGGFGPIVAFAALLNAGTYQFNPIFSSATPAVAPGEIVAVFSKNTIGPDSSTPGQIQEGKVTTSLAGTRILFDGVPAPLLLAQQDFALAIVPASVSGKSTTVVQVERNGVQLGGGFLHSVQQTFPGIFTADASGKGQIAANNEDSSLNSSSNPAAAGSILSFYVTGGGLPQKPLADGQVMDSNLIGLQAPVYVRLGKIPAQLVYAGSIPTAVNGALLVQIRVPTEQLPGPAVPIQLILGNYASPPGTTIAIK